MSKGKVRGARETKDVLRGLTLFLFFLAGPSISGSLLASQYLSLSFPVPLSAANVLDEGPKLGRLVKDISLLVLLNKAFDVVATEVARA